MMHRYSNADVCVTFIVARDVTDSKMKVKKNIMQGGRGRAVKIGMSLIFDGTSPQKGIWLKIGRFSSLKELQQNTISVLSDADNLLCIVSDLIEIKQLLYVVWGRYTGITRWLSACWNDFFPINLKGVFKFWQLWESWTGFCSWAGHRTREIGTKVALHPLCGFLILGLSRCWTSFFQSFPSVGPVLIPLDHISLHRLVWLNEVLVIFYWKYRS